MAKKRRYQGALVETHNEGGGRYRAIVRFWKKDEDNMPVKVVRRTRLVRSEGDALRDGISLAEKGE